MFLSFPPGTEMVHFPGFARAQLCIHRAVRGFCPRGFPHSEIPGSKPVCGSPRLIAAYHVLHRLLLPRHPPCALSSLTIKFTQHTAASPRTFGLSASSSQRNHSAPRKFNGPYFPLIARSRLRVTYPSGLLQALIKFVSTSPCNLPNLFSCQISSSPAFTG